MSITKENQPKINKYEGRVFEIKCHLYSQIQYKSKDFMWQGPLSLIQKKYIPKTPCKGMYILFQTCTNVTETLKIRATYRTNICLIKPHNEEEFSRQIYFYLSQKYDWFTYVYTHITHIHK